MHKDYEDGEYKVLAKPTIDINALCKAVYGDLVDIQGGDKSLSPNERAGYLSLARDLVARDILQQAITEKVASPKDVGILKGLRDREMKLSASIIKKEKALGIDPEARHKRGGVRRGDEVVHDLIVQTKTFRADHIIHVQHCGILLGFFCIHFPKHFPREITVRCPRCNEEFTVELVRDRDLELYVEAQEFAPEGAPKHLVPTRPRE